MFLTLRDHVEPDIGSLLRGSIEFKGRTRLVAITPEDGREHPLDAAEAAVLSGIGVNRWHTLDEIQSSAGFDVNTLQSLFERGLLLKEETDSAPPIKETTPARRAGWNHYAHLYHLMSRWDAPVLSPEDNQAEVPTSGGNGSDTEAGGTFDTLLKRYGAPPPAFFSAGNPEARLSLPPPDNSAQLYDTLRRRETTRQFDESRTLPRAQLANLLFYTFGCLGTRELAEDLTVLKKTSPSGGALHPIEAYPVIANVEGIPSGIYHYTAEHHGLESVKALEESAIRVIMRDFAAGQDWFESAHCMIVMVARFDRHFWKYRYNSKAYRVIYLDAGHLSQTFYLLCTEMGLGAFFTGAINDDCIEDHLGLATDTQGAVGICGCGIPLPGDELRFDYMPYDAGGE